MRLLAFSGLLAMLLSGCGRGGDDSASAGTKTAGVPLSIASTKSATAAGDTSKQKPEQFAPEIRQLLQRANAAVVAGRNAAAVEALSQAIGTTPDDARLFRMRGDVYVLQGEDANARADFSTAIRLAPNDADLHNFRGYFLMSRGLSDEALKDFDRAIELKPTHSAALNNRGLMALAKADYPAAKADFTKAIEADNTYTDAWNNRAFARMKSQENDEAMADIRQTLRLNDKYVTAWNNCGLIAMQQEDYPEAIRAFSRAVELAPLDARWLAHRREALLKAERFTEAQADTSRIDWLAGLQQISDEAARNAGSSDAWIRRGVFLMEGKEFGAAAQDFTRAIMISPNHPEALAFRAKAWTAMGDFQKAMLDCDASLQQTPGHDAYSLRGDLWMRLDDFDKAIADYEAAHRFDEQVASAYDQRAVVRRSAGQIAEADADGQRAKDIRMALEDKPEVEPQAEDSTGFDPASTAAP
ncbi:MAG: tetratricopeptide repeat protein [Planctomycetia bacterium]